MKGIMEKEALTAKEKKQTKALLILRYSFLGPLE